MAAPVGNQNAVGNKGGGRKSAYQENADASMLREMFLTPMSRDEVQAKLKSGKYSLKDLFVSKGYAGNERMLLALFHKSFFRICVEAVELDETSRQAEAEEPRPKFYILSKRDMSTTPYTLNQLGIVVAESIEEAAAKVGATIIDRVDRPESAVDWALLDDERDLTEMPEVTAINEATLNR